MKTGQTDCDLSFKCSKMSHERYKPKTLFCLLCNHLPMRSLQTGKHGKKWSAETSIKAARTSSQFLLSCSSSCCPQSSSSSSSTAGALWCCAFAVRLIDLSTVSNMMPTMWANSDAWTIPVPTLRMHSAIPDVIAQSVSGSLLFSSRAKVVLKPVLSNCCASSGAMPFWSAPCLATLMSDAQACKQTPRTSPHHVVKSSSALASNGNNTSADGCTNSKKPL
mmetsp:Transcript_165733/g.532142  ORF Transcript_165733/g.532142 Transcript_165733/m.532142 type:complete len:221 (+) Transcript_165733:640-1302(+)